MKKTAIILSLLGLWLGICSTAWGFPAVQVYQKTSSSVVLIVASGSGSGSMLGTGSIISDNGLVITNAHVVVDGDSGRPFPKVKVYTKPAEVTGDIRRDLTNPHEATVAAYNSELDLAVLKVSGLSASDGRISLANPREIMVGEEVVAIGHPEQGGLWTLTYGRISGQIANQSNIKGKDVFQTDTNLNRGNSGGPLLDRRGYMVGVNTNIARRGSGDIAITGVNFALKSSVVSSWLATQNIALGYGTEQLYAEQEAVPVAPAPMREEQKLAAAEPPKQAPAPAYAPEPEQRQVASTEAEDADQQTIKNKRKRDRKVRKGAQQPVPVQEQPQAQPEVAKAEPPKPPAPAEQRPKDWLDSDKELKSGDMLTPKRPYSEDDVFKQAEIELEDMMNEMKMKFRK